MKKFILLLLILSFYTSCHSKNDYISTEDKTEIQQKDSLKEENIDYNIALDFANKYVDYINDTIGKISVDEYVKQDELLTDNFKNRYQSIIDSANRVEPEIGLDFDPIINGQDFPDKGFKIKSIDKSSGFVTLQGIDWEDFEMVLKVVIDKNKSLVDGAGIINVPTNK